MKRTLIALSLVVLLAGCSAPAPTEAPSPSIPSPTAVPMPTATAVPLPAPTKMQEQLPDTTTVEFSSDLGPESPTFFEDSRADGAAGTWAMSVACASETGDSITLVLSGSVASGATFEAPCGEVASTITSAGPTFTSSGPYRVDVTSEVAAVVAIGFTPAG